MSIGHRILFLALLALTINISDASAKVIWDEAVDGDLPNFAPPPTLTLSTGANKVIGSTCIVPALNPQCAGGLDTADDDSFAFTVPSGRQLAGIMIHYKPTFLTSGGSNFGRAVWALADTGGNIGTDEIIFTTSATANEFLFELLVPLGSGTYGFEASQLGLSNGWIADYTITLLVVPEPATLALLGIGLAGLGFSRRRTQ